MNALSLQTDIDKKYYFNYEKPNNVKMFRVKFLILFKTAVKCGKKKVKVYWIWDAYQFIMQMMKKYMNSSYNFIFCILYLLHANTNHCNVNAN